jgi:hypothetical protein
MTESNATAWSEATVIEPLNNDTSSAADTVQRRATSKSKESRQRTIRRPDRAHATNTDETNGIGADALPKTRPDEAQARQVRQRLQTVQTEAEPKIDYDAAVAEAKKIIARMETSQDRRMRLGELADQVEKSYGERKLERFAADIGMTACTLGRCRSVFRAWRTKKAPAPKSYSVAQELQTHPDRFELIRRNPNMTKHEARKIRHRLRKEQQGTAGYLLEEQKRWFKAVVEHANAVLRAAAVLDSEVAPQVLQALREAIQPKLLPDLREAGKALIRFVPWFERVANGEAPNVQLPDEGVE